MLSIAHSEPDWQPKHTRDFVNDECSRQGTNFFNGIILVGSVSCHSTTSFNLQLKRKSIITITTTSWLIVTSFSFTIESTHAPYTSNRALLFRISLDNHSLDYNSWYIRVWKKFSRSKAIDVCRMRFASSVRRNVSRWWGQRGLRIDPDKELICVADCCFRSQQTPLKT